VAVSASYPGFCHSVLSNEVQAVELLVEHLLSLGHLVVQQNVALHVHDLRDR
jgi:DNA-binding LacI/PurR family transcriptional regulator